MYGIKINNATHYVPFPMETIEVKKKQEYIVPRKYEKYEWNFNDFC